MVEEEATLIYEKTLLFMTLPSRIKRAKKL